MESKRPLLKSVLAILPLLGLAVSVPTLAEEHGVEWGYGGTHNPTHWGELSRDFYLCEDGRDQSPINLVNVVESTPAALEFNYQAVPLVMMNNGHTIEAVYGQGSSIRLDGESYQLLQFHFHTPSEHTIAGKAAPIELHLVHGNAQNQLAVVSVMIEPGETHPVLQNLWAHIPSQGVTEEIAGATVNAASLLPPNHGYLTYRGSLTTPPCSEGVQWIVLDDPIQASEAQIQAFERLYPVNARPIQSTNGRQVEHHN